MAKRNALEPVGLELLLEVPAQQAGGVYAPPGQDPGGMDGGGLDMKLLKPGDPCPCCGRPIKTRDPERLALLTWISRKARFPTAEEIRALREEIADAQ